MKKDQIQKKAKDIWESNDKRGTLAIATGVGKSKIFIDILKEDTSEYKALLAVPTEVLRDTNWPKEFFKWDGEDVFQKVRIECHASIHTIKGQTFKYLCVDEAHKITPLFMELFKNNTIENILFLTATPPSKFEKQELINRVAPVVFEYSLDQAVEDGVVTPYILNIHELYLDNKIPEYRVGQTPKTELQAYQILTDRVELSKTGTKSWKFAIFARNRFIYNLNSKTRTMQKLIADLNQDDRYLVFAGSTKQADILCKHTYHSKNKKNGIASLNSFCAKEINLLGCVDALNEGITINDLDGALISQVKHDSIHLIQRIGRTIRLRDQNSIAKIHILKAMYTSDEKWVNNAISTLGQENIIYHRITNL